MANTNLRIELLDFLIFIDGAEYLEEDSSGLVGLPKLSPASDIDMGHGTHGQD